MCELSMCELSMCELSMCEKVSHTMTCFHFYVLHQKIALSSIFISDYENSIINNISRMKNFMINMHYKNYLEPKYQIKFTSEDTVQF